MSPCVHDNKGIMAEAGNSVRMVGSRLRLPVNMHLLEACIEAEQRDWRLSDRAINQTWTSKRSLASRNKSSSRH